MRPLIAAALGVLLISLIPVAAVSAAPASAATGVASKLQLRGHLPELGERPALRVFQTQATYDSFRTSLGEANVFPAASNMFMSFDRDILALYTRGNDSGGRCLQPGSTATVDGNTVTLDLQWQNGTCGAPISAHYPFILVSLARADSAGSSWVLPARSVCGSAPGVDARACVQIGGATASPTASPASTPTATPQPTTAATASPAAQPTAVPTATRTASPTPTRTIAPTPPPVAVASPPSAPTEPGPNYLLYGAVIAAGLLLLLALALARPRRRSDR